MPAVPAIDTAARRCAAVLTAVLLLPPLAGCTSDGGEDPKGRSGAARDVPSAARERVAEGGTLRWAVDEPPTTLNVFQPDANKATSRIAAATLPQLFTLDSRARPQRNEAYLRSAEITQREPRQTVVYTLAEKARWSDGRAIGVADFKAQWKALNGRNSAFWAARNAGYERIRKVEKGPEPRQVKVTFGKPYAEWQSLFTPLYPKSVMERPEAFNEGARTGLPVSGGPFQARKTGGAESKDKTATLVRNPEWWGPRAKLDRILLRAVPQGERQEALAAGELDLAEVDTAVAKRIAAARSGGAHKGDADSGRTGSPEAAGEGRESVDGAPAGGPVDTVYRPRAGMVAVPDADGATEDDKNGDAAEPRRHLREYAVRRALDPAYTQLALNGANGPLADHRVRRAVARTIDREALAREALGRAGLPAQPLGSHLRMRDQHGYHDNSDALGGRDVESAQALLADAGWKGATVTGPDRNKDEDTEADAKTDDRAPRGDRGGDGDRDSLAAPVTKAEAARIQSGPLSLAPDAAAQRAGLLAQLAREADRAARDSDSEKRERRAREAKKDAGNARARADEMRLLTDGRASAVRVRKGQPLSLRFVLPAGPGSESIQRSGQRIARTLNTVGIRTEIEKIKDESYFRDHIASGDYDLALYTWPASAYPATDAEPIFAKPTPAQDGTLTVEQNYTRVGTDRIDQLFEEAAAELDDGERQDLLHSADARIWAAAGSVPLYQRPQLVAARTKIVNAGAFGFETPRYQDIGYRK
ncbi:ABC transporter family substrate-binding protein [Streptomyces armeniacus]|uniref:ABC transporter family substrate-binding protein n=1 Tax=Streptomyces armeniacus TaxID=83291 RepID=A0A345XQM9_9ACTN|nr:ABC transporter family substrate-binding protein [Streptomyces armeniacus]AXK33945.1 ABC transporter family substrate-binding protein [Streptomyces armeniacus]